MASRYLLFQRAEAALLKEKAQKLFGLTRILDAYLKGDYRSLLRRQGVSPSSSREEKIRALNKSLAPFTDLVVSSSSGVGAGYYSLELEAILTYGPSREFGNKVGVTIGLEHLGRKTMSICKEIVGVGSMVRGEIMNCTHPLIRKGEVIGFIWANETLEEIYHQIESGARQIFFSSNIDPMLGLTGLLLLASRVFLQFSPSANAQETHSSTLIWHLNYIQRYLEIFLNSLNLGIVIVNIEGNVIFKNRGLYNLLGVKEENHASPHYQHYREFFTRLGLESVKEKVEKLSDGQRHFSNLEIKTTWGKELELGLIIALIEETPGRELGKVFLLENLAKAQEEEKRQERTDKLATLGELAAFIAHEIRNPLAIVSGSVQLVPQKLEDRNFLQSFSHVVTQELARINNIIESLLGFARFSEPTFSTLDLNSLLSNTLNFVRFHAYSYIIEIEEKYHLFLPEIEGDASHLEQAFINLFMNAFQAMPKGGKLTVTTRHRGENFVLIEIADTGEGIEPEVNSHIFDAFYSARKGGTGLGLSLVHRIIDEHRGLIEFESEKGKGTTFYIHLPIRQPPFFRRENFEV